MYFSTALLAFALSDFVLESDGRHPHGASHRIPIFSMHRANARKARIKRFTCTYSSSEHI